MLTRDNHIIRDRLVIISLLEGIVYIALWVWNEFVAFYVSVIFPVMFFLLLIFAAVSDWIEPSRVPKWYYILMFVSIIIPLLVGGLFYLLYEGQFNFLSE